jgi:DNA-binding response OmpR family regulator
MLRTILLADDSPTIRRLVTQTFADANFKIVEVNNGDAAIRTFEEVRPSVVLADIYMPGKNGYQVCTHIRGHSELNETPVVLLVGAFEAFDEDTAKQAGATASITKPFEPGALIELVNSVLRPEKAEPPAQPISPVVAQPAQAGPVHSEPAEKPVEESEDLLGLTKIFREDLPRPHSGMIAEEDIDRIADRVIQKISTQVVENIAWEVVPDITARVVREELKRAK